MKHVTHLIYYLKRFILKYRELEKNSNTSTYLQTVANRLRFVQPFCFFLFFWDNIVFFFLQNYFTSKATLWIIFLVECIERIRRRIWNVGGSRRICQISSHATGYGLHQVSIFLHFYKPLFAVLISQWTKPNIFLFKKQPKKRTGIFFAWENY